MRDTRTQEFCFKSVFFPIALFLHHSLQGHTNMHIEQN